MEAYQIGVKIALSNGMSPVLAVISKELLGINSTVKQIEGNFKKWAIVAGSAGSVLAGGAIIRGWSKIAEHGKEILHQQEMMRQAGMQNKEVVEATAKAWDTSRKIQVTTAAENLKHLRELRYATGDTEGAMAILNPVTKANAILNAVKGGAGGTDQVFELVKALEQKGLATSENRGVLLSYVDQMTKVVQATGGRVTPQMFQQTFKYGRTAMLGWDEDFITKIMPRLMQSWSSAKGGGGGGSGGPGNALMTAFSTITSGIMSKSQADTFEKLHLLASRHNIRGSSRVQALVKGRDLFMANPYEWSQQIEMPALKGLGITGQNDIIAANQQLFLTRTAAAVMAEFSLQGRFHDGSAASPFEKDVRVTKTGLGLAGFGSLVQNDPNTVEKMYSQQRESALSAIGVALLPVKLELIKALTSMFTSIAQFASGNPETIKAIGKAMLVLGGALVVGGVVALGLAIAGLTAASAPAVAAIYAVAGALAGAKALMEKVMPYMPSMGTGAGAGAVVPGTEGMPTFQRQNYMPPARGGGSSERHAAVYLDGRKVGEAVLSDFNRRASLPVEGSPVHDRTWQASSLDNALG